MKLQDLKRDFIFLVVVGLIVALDQVTKWLMRTRPDIAILGDFFKLSLSKNTGIAFGLAQGNNLFFAALTGVIVVVLLVYYATLRREKPLPAALTAVIIGGAIGNLIDRFVFGEVTDFIAFYFWPSFNIADAAITLGVIGLIYYLLRNDYLTGS